MAIEPTVMLAKLDELIRHLNALEFEILATPGFEYSDGYFFRCLVVAVGTILMRNMHERMEHTYGSAAHPIMYELLTAAPVVVASHVDIKTMGDPGTEHG